MTIKARLQVSAGLSLGVAFLVGLVLSAALRDTNRSVAERREVDAVVRGVFELGALTDDYLSDHGRRAQEQWLSRHASLRLDLEELRLSEPGASNGPTRLRRHHRAIETIFTELCTNYEARLARRVRPDISLELEERLAAQLAVQSQALVTEAFQLADASRANAVAAQSRASRLATAFAVIMAVVMVLTMLWIGHAVVRPIDRLRRGVETIAAGDMDHRVGIVRGDEIGRLSEAFDDMTVRLSDSYKALAEAEASAQRENQFINAVLGIAGALVVVLDRDGLIVRFNRTCETVTGYSFDEVRGRPFWDLFLSPDEAPRVMKVWRELLAAHFPLEEENHWLTRDGGRRLIAWSNTCLLDDAGAVEYVIATGVDISERHRAEEQLRLDEARLRTLLTLSEMAEAPLEEITNFALEEAIRLTNSEIGYLAFTNDDETVLTMHAWSKTAMEQCAMTDRPIVYPVEDTGLWGEAVRQRRPVMTNDYSAPNPHKKGYPEGHCKVTRHLNIPVFEGEHIAAVAGVGNKSEDYNESDVLELRLLMDGMWRLAHRKRIADELRRANDELEQRVAARTVELAEANDELRQEVTDHKHTQEHLREARDAAQAASKAKSEFLANMSHEIRTPMNGIIGMTDLALNTDLTAEQRDYLMMVRDSADALLHLLNDILDYSKIEAGRLDLESTPFRLRETLGDALKSLSIRAHAKHLELAYRIAPGIPDSLKGDPWRLRQVVVNLVGNAIKFTEVGEVVVEVVEERSHGAETVLHFSVRDTGVGIPEDKQAAVLESFTQADSSTTRRYGGTGLGLAISAQLVEMMGGEIWLESEEGVGSTFHFLIRLEVLGDDDEQLPAWVDVEGVPVLVVDDNQTNRRILEELLQGWGMTPTCVGDAETALQMLRDAPDGKPGFGIAILDIMMPHTDGFELAKRIRQQSNLQHIPIIMLSSAGVSGEAARGASLRVDRVLTKPVKQSELLDSVLGALARRQSDTVKVDAAGLHDLGETGRALHVLLAEDNVVNQRLASRILEKRGHHVQVVSDGLQALRAWERQAFDVIVMDVQMPEMDGFSATASIRQQESATGDHVPIVAMTAHALEGDRERCLAAGMDDYVSKPLTALSLVQAVETWGSQRAPVAETDSVSVATPPQRVLIDRQSILSRMYGDENLLREMTSLFLSSHGELLDKCRQAIESQDAEALRRAAHSLKGMLGNFDPDVCFGVALELEGIGREGGDLARASAVLRRLTRHVEGLKAALMGLQENTE